MNLELISLLAIALFTALNGAVYYTYLWQLKEYRWDRFIEAVNQASFREKVFSRFLVGKWLFFIIGALLYWSEQLSFEKMTELVLLGVFLELADLVWRALKRRVYRPDFTLKAILIIFVEVALFAGAALCFYFLGMSWHLSLFWILVMSCFVSDINAIIIFLINPITDFLKNRKIRAAKMKILRRTDLKVIGITGSFGKSSTKEFLYQILSRKFFVLKTPGNTNVDIGVASVILNKLENEHQIFIVEMGAYKKGEIKKIVDIVHPDIGILTAVDKAHIGLFGSEENVLKAKMELIEGVREGGVGIFNIDSAGAAKGFSIAEKRILRRISVSCLENQKADLKAEKIRETENGLSFVCEGFHFSPTLLGVQNIPNLLMAMAAARECGMTMDEIASAVSEIKPLPRTMQLIEINENIAIIDDSYNANPVGVAAAIDSLRLFKGRKKIVVFPGMLELGKHAHLEHVKIASYLAENADLVFVTSNDFKAAMEEGLNLENIDNGKKAAAHSNKAEFIFSSDRKLIQAEINKLIDQNEKIAILIESRGGEFLIDSLKKR